MARRTGECPQADPVWDGPGNRVNGGGVTHVECVNDQVGS